MIEYQIQFFEHSNIDSIENFLNRLRADGITVSDDGDGIYTLVADREGKADRLRFFLFDSAYSKKL